MIISISGLAGSGKDTIGNILIKKHNFTRIAFADALKSICSTITGLSWDMFNDPNLKDKELDNEVVFDQALAASLAFELNELGYNVIPSKFNSLLGAKLETPRKILVFIGTDVCRNHVEETIWRDVTLKKIKNTEGHVVITDARFKTYGCGSAIASSSLVTEGVKGKTLDQAGTIRNTHIAEELALPPVKIHCSILAEDAIKAAIADFKSKYQDNNNEINNRENQRGTEKDTGHTATA